jgi:hypothetical protein
MSKLATATFRVNSWDEEPYDETEGGPKLTRARVAKVFSGDIEGDSVVEYLMVHRPDGTSSFVGVERVVGRLGDMEGSFVLQHGGTYVGGVAKAEWSVVLGSGTGALSGLRGEGGFESGHAEEYSMTLEYDLE